MRTWLGVGLFLIALSTPAQPVDWTRTAPTLTALNVQILDWAAEYQKLAAVPVTAESLAAVVTLHFQRGPVVINGFKALLDTWKKASETQKKGRYLAVARYFAIHCDDWGSMVAWRWYDCFSPPLDARYNDAAGNTRQQTVLEASPLSVADLGEEKRRLVDLSLSDINGFLTAYGYPIVDALITRFDYSDQGILVDGRIPRDRQLLNTAFTFSGTLVELFGPGF